jgi:hypothetical protein
MLADLHYERKVKKLTTQSKQIDFQVPQAIGGRYHRN